MKDTNAVLESEGKFDSPYWFFRVPESEPTSEDESELIVKDNFSSTKESHEYKKYPSQYEDYEYENFFVLGSSKYLYDDTDFDEMTEKQFQKLSNRWKKDTQFLSNASKICTHPDYQKIIELGKPALPFIFRELDKKPLQWFWALKEITGADPVPEDKKGDVRTMQMIWLKWAETYGYHRS